MSKQNINMSSPKIMNISPQNISGKCDLKCAYNFKYSESNSSATNRDIMITITYDNSNGPPVIYNDKQYDVSQIQIVRPSSTLFNGKRMPGEIRISHTPIKGGPLLFVNIPFIMSSETSPASNLLTEVIRKVASIAPSSGKSTNLNMADFNLQTIIPRKPFYTYTFENTDYIVFGDLQSIPLSSETIKTLQQIIKPFPLQIPAVELFYNSKGPTSGIQIGDGLYISCRPTGSTEEEKPVIYDKPTTTSELSNIFDNEIFLTVIQIVICFIILIIIFKGISLFYNYISSSSETLKFPMFSK
jgi:carbonic anhydrase